MPHYRTATPADEPGLHALWAAAFPDAAATVGALWAGDPGRHARTFVADDGGRVVSALHYRPRPIRSATGRPQRVGCLGGVATHPGARGRGHVRRLLGAAVAAMTADGCAWSLLFTATPGVYEGAGWRSFRATGWSGPPAGPAAPRGGSASVRPATGADLGALKVLRDAYDEARPLTTVRSLDDWRRRIPHWYGPPGRILIAEQAERAEHLSAGPGARAGRARPLGFVVVRHPGPGHAEVAEIALARGHEDAAAEALLAAAAEHARAAGAVSAGVRLPAEPAVLRALPRLLAQATPETTAYGMARPLLSPAAEVASTVGAPLAAHWYGDSF